ncbi:hypothetical protein QAD02_007258 [Eretmocerus hayati]|uniref:Uncharacterized protein n=1 Tax=Eretmocerus hayati TaxID=131215 RepID=A0ACC2N3Z4_9HYME|nr:hypothetical protein QAD02_007258 [Eretmocerus hayati]
MQNNVRRTSGRGKGRFVQQRVKSNIDSFLQRVDEKQGRPTPSKDGFSQQGNSPTDALVFPPHFGGRRLVEIEKLFYDMWCKNCDNAIGIRTFEHESFNGIVSKWHIRCETYSTVIVVDTSKKSNEKNYDTNLKLATGVLDAGIGETKENTLLSVINSPTIHHSTLNKHERVVGPVIERVANASCVEAMQEEKLLTVAFNNSQTNAGADVNNNCVSTMQSVTPFGSPALKDCAGAMQAVIPFRTSTKNNCVVAMQTMIPFKGSFDTAWPKRGKSHKSPSGHATVIGHFSGKIIAYDVRNSKCKQCLVNKDKHHDCRHNHRGSAKAMEADMAVECILKNQNLVDANCRIETLIGDDDSAAIAVLQKLYPLFPNASSMHHLINDYFSSLRNS